MQYYHLGELLVGDVMAPAHTLNRTPGMIEQQGLDHILLQFYRRGHSVVETDTGTVPVSETQAIVLDLAQPVRIVAAAVDATNVVLPRRLLQEQGCSPEGLHGRAFDHDGDPFGRLLHASLINVAACGDRLQQHEASSAAHAIVKLCGAYLRGRATSPVPNNFDVSIRVRRLIEEELHNPALTPALIAQKLRISRSALYRLFGETGGVLAYIRDRRLMRAMQVLVRDDGIAPRRVTKLAYAVGGSDEKTFQRAFSRRFGFVPSGTTSYCIGNENRKMDTPVLRSWIDNL